MIKSEISGQNLYGVYRCLPSIYISFSDSPDSVHFVSVYLSNDKRQSRPTFPFYYKNLWNSTSPE